MGDGRRGKPRTYSGFVLLSGVDEKLGVLDGCLRQDAVAQV